MSVPLGLQGASGRPLVSYETFSHENARRVPADVAKLRDMVRGGLRYGWSRLEERRDGVMRWEVNSAGECAEPVLAHFRGVELPLPGSRMPSGIRSYLVSTARRCRRCEWCKMMRSSHWSHRARTEFDRAARTWLGTVTLSPFNHAVIDAKVASKAHSTAARFMSDWSDSDLFRERCEIMGELITKWIKAMRQAEYRRRAKEAMKYRFVIPGKVYKRRTRISFARFCVVPAKFKFLLVAEMHKSERTSTTMVGRPHYHMLIHEPWPFELVRPHEYYHTTKGAVRVADAALIRKGWQLGFTQYELCREARQASYLCKYLAKDMLWRVRASQHYGETVVETGSVSGRRATTKERGEAGHLARQTTRV